MRTLIIVISVLTALVCASLSHAATKVLFSDNFDDNTVGSLWKFTNGTWAESGGVMTETSNYYDDTWYDKVNGGAYALVDTDFQSGYSMSAAMKSTDDDRLGVVIYFQDWNNYYLFVWESQTAMRVLAKYVNGVETRLAEDAVAYVPGTTYQIRIRSNAQNVTVSIDGVDILSAKDAAYRSGRAGFFSSGNTGSIWDDLRIEVEESDPAQTVLFSDNFDDNTVGPLWKFTNGTWTESDGVMTETSNYYDDTWYTKVNGGAYALVDTDFQSGYSMSAAMKSTDNDRLGIVVYFQDWNNYYLFVWESETAMRVLAKYVNGVETRLAEDAVAYVPGTTYQIRIRSDAQNVTVSVDGVDVLSAKDAAYRSGRAGFFSSGNTGSIWDDLRIEVEESDPAQTVLFSDNFDDNTVGPLWKFTNGTWSEADSVMTETSNYYDDTWYTKVNGGAYALVDSSFQAAYTTSVTMKSNDDDRLGVVCYFQDWNNYYLFVWECQTAMRVLAKYVNGVETRLAEDAVAYVPGTSYRIVIRPDGENVVVSVDGVDVLTAKDATYRSGKAGLFSSGNSGSIWDDFTLTGPTLRPPSQVAVTDVPNDNGHKLRVTWTLSPDDASCAGYRIYRSRSSVLTTPVSVNQYASFDKLKEAELTTTILIDSVPRGQNYYVDANVPLNGVNYYYWVQAVSSLSSSAKIMASPLQTSVEEVPSGFRVSGFYPNPFNPSTAIRFELAEKCRVTLVIYDVIGRKTATLMDRDLPPGSHSLNWNGRDQRGAMLGSGVYLYRLRAGEHAVNGKITLLR